MLWLLGTFAYAVLVNCCKLLGIATVLLIGLVVHSLAAAFFHFVRPTTLAWLVLRVFSLLAVGDFARVRAGGGGTTALKLALGKCLSRRAQPVRESG